MAMIDTYFEEMKAKGASDRLPSTDTPPRRIGALGTSGSHC